MTAPKLDIDVTKLDLYAILAVDENATEKEIVKSYRKQALKWHPDKNPDNPAAVEVFHKLSKALEILTDAPARVAYDKIQKAKKAAEKRHKELDSKRKKLKEDLETRENAAQSQKDFDVAAKKNFQAEIERLRKEGSKMLEKEQQLLQEELKKTAEAKQKVGEEAVTPKLKIKWKAKKGDESNGGYSYTVLQTMFSKYGDVLNLLISNKKNGSAILELSSEYAAQMAVQNEKGLAENPLTLNWLEGQPVPLGPAAASEAQSQPDYESEDTADDRFTMPNTTKAERGDTWSAYQSSTEKDYESLVLMKMRQAQERQRLIEQMKKEDEDT